MSGNWNEPAPLTPSHTQIHQILFTCWDTCMLEILKVIQVIFSVIRVDRICVALLHLALFWLASASMCKPVMVKLCFWLISSLCSRYKRVFSVGTHGITTYNPTTLEVTNQVSMCVCSLSACNFTIVCNQTILNVFILITNNIKTTF